MTKTRILVVDDELFVRELLEEFFGKTDYLVDTAKNAEEALELLDEHEYQAALFDLKLPDMDGVELLERVRAAGNDMPVVFMTGYPTVDSAVSALRNQAHDYVLKPFRLQELESTVAAAIRAPRYSYPTAVAALMESSQSPLWADETIDRIGGNRLLKVSEEKAGAPVRRLRLARNPSVTTRA
ncbi:MAG: response regulator [bacterium]